MKSSFHIVLVTFCSWALLHEERKHDIIIPGNMHANLSILQVGNVHLQKGPSYQRVCTICVSVCTGCSMNRIGWFMGVHSLVVSLLS